MKPSWMTMTVLVPLGLVACVDGDAPGSLTEPPPSGPVSADRQLPPLYGGTVRALSSTPHVVVADPDRARVVFVDTNTLDRRQLDLREGDRPFRVVEHGGSGRVSVVLRGAGAVLTMAGDGSGTPDRRPVCADPRGAAFDAVGSRLLVACAGGELVALAEPDGRAQVVARLDRDLRDVVIAGDVVSVSTFRSAALIQLSRRDLAETSRLAPTPVFDFRGRSPEARVAWRSVAGPAGQVVMAHQFAQTVEVNTDPAAGGYAGGLGGGGGDGGVDFGDGDGGLAGGGCGGGTGIVTNAVTFLSPGGTRTVSILNPGIPLDVAVSPDGAQVVMVLSNNLPGLARVVTARFTDVEAQAGNCGGMFWSPTPESTLGLGLVTAIDFTPDGRLVTLQSEPDELYVGGRAVDLQGASVVDTGRDTFHMVTPAGLACASCHPEGGEDGHTWQFVGLGPRRTQSLRGGLGDSAPFHWSGDMMDFSTLVRDVMTGRMQGPELSDGEQRALKSWIDAIPADVGLSGLDADAVQRGRGLFDAQGCASCHGSVRPVASVDVGTGGPFQVPSLKGLAHRAPYLHSGCAPTLRDRFSPGCGGGDQHGVTSRLSADELDDLIAYLESL